MTIKINQAVFTIDREIAIALRIEKTPEDQIQVYGVFCTGPLTHSTNAIGEPNEFLLTLDEHETKRALNADPLS